MNGTIECVLSFVWLLSLLIFIWDTSVLYRQQFVYLYCQVVVHCMDIPQFIYPLTCWWAFLLLPFLKDYYKWNLCECCMYLFIAINFFFSWIVYTKFSSVAQSCPTFCDPMDCSTPGYPVYHWLSELTQIHVHRVSDAVQPKYWPGSKYWNFNFNISPSSKYSGLISLRMD